MCAADRPITANTFVWHLRPISEVRLTMTAQYCFFFFIDNKNFRCKENGIMDKIICDTEINQYINCLLHPFIPQLL